MKNVADIFPPPFFQFGEGPGIDSFCANPGWHRKKPQLGWHTPKDRDTCAISNLFAPASSSESPISIDTSDV